MKYLLLLLLITFNVQAACVDTTDAEVEACTLQEKFAEFQLEVSPTGGFNLSNDGATAWDKYNNSHARVKKEYRRKLGRWKASKIMGRTDCSSLSGANRATCRAVKLLGM